MAKEKHDEKAAGSTPPAEEKVIPVTEETATVGVRRVETGRVVVRKRVEEHVENVAVPVGHEVVEVRRVPVNRPVDSPPPIERTADAVIVPVVEEEVVVTKRLVVKEEVHLMIRRTTETREQSVTLKRERAEVERRKAS